MAFLPTVTRRSFQPHFNNAISRRMVKPLLKQSRSMVTVSTRSNKAYCRLTSSLSSSLVRHRQGAFQHHGKNIRSLSVLAASPVLSPRARNSLYPQGWTNHQQRHASWLPEVISNFSIWGGSGWMLKAIHMEGMVPYWACFAVISLSVRTLLFPVVLYGAHMSSRFAKILPEMQYLVSWFSQDMNQLRKRNAPWAERFMLMRLNWKTVKGIYQLHRVKPYAVFLSPLMQLPIFWYISVDLRKIVNGLDPLLAQELVESPVAWIPDLTEADPWYGLPVMAGLLMYANVEVAVGKRSLAGPSTAKADTGVLLKDIFQSVAVFMPCFTSQMPAGVQIYVVTSFCFTMVQSAALRNATCRSLLSLPPIAVPGDGSTDPKNALQFIKLKELEQKAREIRGDGPLLGKGVLQTNYEGSLPGTYRESTIEVDKSQIPMASVQATTAISSTESKDASNPANKATLDVSSSPFAQLPYIHGVSAPPWQIAEQKHLFEKPAPEQKTVEALPDFSDEVMAKANRGEMPMATKFVDRTANKTKLVRNPVRVNKKMKKGKKKR